MEDAVGVALSLLGSSVASDLLEVTAPIDCGARESKSLFPFVQTIKFLVTASEFRLEPAKVGVRRMLALVWSKDAPVRCPRDVCLLFFDDARHRWF